MRDCKDKIEILTIEMMYLAAECKDVRVARVLRATAALLGMLIEAVPAPTALKAGE